MFLKFVGYANNINNNQMNHLINDDYYKKQSDYMNRLIKQREQLASL